MKPQETLLLPAFNHLLAQEPWAREKLQAHAGKIACIDLSGLTLRAEINPAGMLGAAPNDNQANVTIHINAGDVPAIAHNPDRAISYVKLEGDADLAQTLSDLGKNLRWDVEQDLSRIVGDIAARRLASIGKAVIGNVKTTAEKLNENLAEYFLEENPMLVRPESVAAFTAAVSRTRDDVERLMKRIEKLEKSEKR